MASDSVADCNDPAPTPSPGHGEPVAPGHRFWPMVLGSIGVVFGDIGTSPLYAMKEALHHSRATT